MRKAISRIGWMMAGFASANLAVFFAMFRSPKRKWEKESYDCAVVCGYFANEDGTPSEMMKSRVDKAAALWKQKKVGYLILSGGAVHNKYVEAEIMKKYAMEQGVPEEYILKEKQAVSTYHNLQYSAKIMDNFGFKDCVVVTNGWHLRKADHYARRARVEYVMAEALNPKGMGWFRCFLMNIQTNFCMYLNMWKGYY